MARATTPERTATTDKPMAAVIRPLMPQLTADLVQLARIPSVSEASFPPEPVHRAHSLVAELLRDAGVRVSTLELPHTYPIVTGEIPAPPGAPTVLLYGHYDVVPPGDASKWTSPPFEPIERHGALYGRGTSDSKANVLAHVGALRAFGGKPPVGIKIVIEGQEETGSGSTHIRRSSPTGSAPTRWSSPTWAAFGRGCRHSRSLCGAWRWSQWR